MVVGGSILLLYNQTHAKTGPSHPSLQTLGTKHTLSKVTYRVKDMALSTSSRLGVPSVRTGVRSIKMTHGNFRGSRSAGVVKTGTSPGSSVVEQGSGRRGAAYVCVHPHQELNYCSGGAWSHNTSGGQRGGARENKGDGRPG